MDIQRLNPESLAKPAASYCQITRRGSIITTAGFVSIDKDGNLVGENDIRVQTRQTIENLKLALEAVGSSIGDVMQTVVYISDMANYKGMNEIYNEYFNEHPPTRATVKAGLVLPSLLVEIQAIAVLDE